MIGEFITRIFGGASNKRPGPLEDFWYLPLTALDGFTPEIGAQLGVVQDSLAALADPIATLPLHIFRRSADGARRRDDAHPAAHVLTRKANKRNTASEFLEFMQHDLGWHRNALAEIVPGERGAIDALLPIAWTRVMDVSRDENDELFYRVRDVRGGARILHEGEVFHLRRAPFNEDCTCGRPVYETGKSTIALAVAIDRYARAFFDNSGKSGGILKMKAPFSTPEAKEKFVSAWRAARTGRNAHGDAVLEHDADYVPFEVKNNEAQFRESKMDALRAVGRLWRMPPHKIGDLERATNSNIEQQSIEFVQDTLLPWLVVWERAIWRDLLLEDENIFAEFDVAGLLRGDLKSRFESYALGRQWGWMRYSGV